MESFGYRLFDPYTSVESAVRALCTEFLSFSALIGSYNDSMEYI